MEFTPEQKVLNDLFGNDITYIIPEYQRPYSWDCIGKSDKNSQVNVMWQDLIEFYESKDPNIYFMGSMVVIGDGTKREFEVVDGQQRLTTLTILLTSIKCFLQEIKLNENIQSENKNEFMDFIRASADNVDKLIFNEKRSGLFSSAEKKVKIARLEGFNYDNVLKTVIECTDISSIDLKDATNEQAIVSQRYFNNRQYFIEQLKNKFLDKNKILTNEKAEDLANFFDFLKNKVTVIQIRAPRFEVAYQIFEILNNRGLPLSNKDLFRNFLISEFSTLKQKNEQKYKAINPNEKWRLLDANYELNAEFISRYVESKRGGKQQYSAFNDLEKEIYKKDFKETLTQSKIELFYEDIEKNLAIYTRIVNLDFEVRNIKNRIIFLTKSGNSSYILNLLMALFRNTTDEMQQLSFLKTFEKYIIHILLGPAKRFKSSTIYDAIKLLNSNKFDEALKKFELSSEEIQKLCYNLDEPIEDNDTAKLLIARYFWANENQVDTDVISLTLDYDKATLEHIIPQNPSLESNWTKDFSKDFRKKFTYKLGNMTLLTQSKNSAAKNYDFDKKKLIYAQTKLKLTNDLANISKIDEKYIQEKHASILKLLLKDLGI